MKSWLIVSPCSLSIVDIDWLSQSKPRSSLNRGCGSGSALFLDAVSGSALEWKAGLGSALKSEICRSSKSVPDPWHFGTDPDPRIRTSPLTEQNSGNKGFFYYFCWMMEGAGSVPLEFWLTDPDPGGPKLTDPTDTDPENCSKWSCGVQWTLTMKAWRLVACIIAVACTPANECVPNVVSISAVAAMPSL